jgi:hypothetical protein
LTLKSQIPAEPGGWAGLQKIAESLLSQRMLEIAWQKSGPWQREQEKETELFVLRPAVITHRRNPFLQVWKRTLKNENQYC